MQVASAPAALVLDALSFVVSAVCLLLIRRSELAPSAAARRHVWSEMQEGLYVIVRSRLLRPLAVSVCVYNFFAAMFVTVYTLFLIRDLGLAPATIGAIVTSSGVGAVLGGLAAHPIAQRFGIGPSIIGGSLVLSVPHFAAPLAGGPPSLVVPLLVTASLMSAGGQLVGAVNHRSLVQHLAPEHALGRVFASQQFIIMAGVPFGSLFGGALGEAVGLRGTLAIASIGVTAGALILVPSPLRDLRALPGPEPGRNERSGSRPSDYPGHVGAAFGP